MANTDPNYWFLPADLMPRAPHFTSGNEVTPLIDGEAYMSHLAARIAAMQDGDYFHLTGWRVSPGQFLEPTLAGPPTFMQQIIALINKGVIVRAMLWYHFGSAVIKWTLPGQIIGVAYKHPVENMEFVQKINAMNSPRAAAILDDRLPRFGAHHQKTIILSSANFDWAYVGGIDICVDRWDTPEHFGPPQRQKELMDAWHDVQIVMRGPAVAQVWNNFRQRWNDDTVPHSIPGVPGGSKPESIAEPPPAGISIGNQHVQVLRTLACKSIYSFLPGGEQTVRLAYERAIERAQHFIYIEDQYFWPCTLTDKLRQAADRGVKIILVLSHKYDIRVISDVHEKMRAEAVTLIRQNNPGNVFVYHLQQTGLEKDIYVHAKLMIVDDCFAAVGSANINKRSHTTDSEMHLGIVDGTTVQGTMNGISVQVCSFAKELRLKLWKEHLGLTNTSTIEDPILGLGQWPDQATSNPASPNRRFHVVVHHIHFPSIDKVSLRRELFKFLELSFFQVPDIVPIPSTGILSDAFLAGLLPDPEQIIRDYIMNVETKC